MPYFITRSIFLPTKHTLIEPHGPFEVGAYNSHMVQPFECYRRLCVVSLDGYLSPFRVSYIQLEEDCHTPVERDARDVVILRCLEQLCLVPLNVRVLIEYECVLDSMSSCGRFFLIDERSDVRTPEPDVRRSVSSSQIDLCDSRLTPSLLNPPHWFFFLSSSTP